jgi:predicted nucleic acid-binding protein
MDAVVVDTDVFSIPLVTHNARHYNDIPGLKLVTHADAPS